MEIFLYIYYIVLHVCIYIYIRRNYHIKKGKIQNMRHIGDEGGLDGGDTFEEEKSTIFWWWQRKN